MSKCIDVLASQGFIYGRREVHIWHRNAEVFLRVGGISVNIYSHFFLTDFLEVA